MNEHPPEHPVPNAGVLLVDKAPGWTSHDVVARIRRITGERRVGHAGTLDPAATGVLVVCVGGATRIVEYLAGLSKVYRATIRFGVETDTWDAEGAVLATRDASFLSRNMLEPLLAPFVGALEQVPPMYSAIKRNGTPLYALARRGQEVEREPRSLTVYRLTVLRWSPPDLDVELHCSTGTYVRSLAHDLGQVTGTGAHLASLRRTAVGHLTLAQASALEALSVNDAWRQALITPAAALRHLPSCQLDDAAIAELRFGRAIPLALVQAPEAVVLALDSAGRLVAVVQPGDRPGWWRPDKVFAD